MLPGGRRSGAPMKICLAASAGGHLIQRLHQTGVDPDVEVYMLALPSGTGCGPVALAASTEARSSTRKSSTTSLPPC